MHPLSSLQASLGDRINIEKYCLWGPYASQLLSSGLALREAQLSIGSGGLGWPLGAALAEALALSSMQPGQGLRARLCGLWPWEQGGKTTGSRQTHVLDGLLWLVAAAVLLAVVVSWWRVLSPALSREPLLPVRMPGMYHGAPSRAQGRP